MRSKGHQSKYSLILLFVGIFAFWWGIAVIARNDTAPYSNTQPVSASSASTAGTYAPQNITGPITIQSSVTNGSQYSYNGSISLPNPCAQLGTGIAVNGTKKEHITIILTLLTPPQCTDTEAAVTQPFAVSLTVASGSEAILDGLTVNGVIVSTLVTKAASH